LTSNDRNFITLEEFLHNKTWNPSISNDPTGKKMLYMRLELKPGTKADQLKITLNGHDLRVQIAGKESADVGQNTSRLARSIDIGHLPISFDLGEHSYRQVTLFPTCDIHQLKTALKNDGFLHIQVPIQL
jgi:HSP20 family molecular chaperone IbpA